MDSGGVGVWGAANKMTVDFCVCMLVISCLLGWDGVGGCGGGVCVGGCGWLNVCWCVCVWVGVCWWVFVGVCVGGWLGVCGYVCVGGCQ